MEGHPDVLSEEGEFSLELRSSNDDVLYRTKFSIQAGWPGASTIFALRVPFKPGTARVIILDDSGVVGKTNRSSNPPEIQISSHPFWDDENNSLSLSLSLSWTASDLDGDEMTYSTHYQCDEASYWIPLSADLSETNFTFDTSGLPGGDRCTVRVMVTDGFNSAEALSDPFFVQSKGPIVDILTESNTFSSDERVLLRGAAMDLEDGVIPSENLHWTSNLDGELGSGSALHIPLSPGTHLVSLYAQDSDGYLSLAQATIQVQSGEILTGMGNGLHLQSLWLIGF